MAYRGSGYYLSGYYSSGYFGPVGEIPVEKPRICIAVFGLLRREIAEIDKLMSCANTTGNLGRETTEKSPVIRETAAIGKLKKQVFSSGELKRDITESGDLCQQS